MKTVAEIAKMTDVSNKTIYRYLDKLRQDIPDGLTESVGGITYFTELGEQKILERLTHVKQVRDMSDSENDKDSQGYDNAKDSQTDEEISYLKELVKELRSEIKIEREHSRTLSDRLVSLTEQMLDLNKNQQVLLGREQEKNMPLLTESDEAPHDEPKKKRWNPFKKRNIE